MHAGATDTQAPSYPQLVRFAATVMFAVIATPLMGMVDTAVLGRLGRPELIAAAGVGATIFSVMYSCFSFLRMTTTGLVAQALGRRDEAEVVLAGLRPMLAALGGGIGLWLLQWPIAKVAFALLTPPAEVTLLAQQYFDARLWSAPFTLLGYAQQAWLLGLGRSRLVMWLQLALNGLNAALALLFVLGFGWGIAGAGWATACSEITLGCVTTLLILREMPWPRWRAALPHAFKAAAWRLLFNANLDIIIRTLLLAGSIALMTERGGKLGTLELAVNQILMQAFMVCANLMDGFAIAAEVFGARAIGAGARATLIATVRRCAALSLGWGLLLAGVLAALAPIYPRLMTANPQLQQEVLRFWPWLVVMPFVCVWAFLWDGVFLGATRTRTLRNTMIISFACYVPAQFGLSALWGNHGVWAAIVALMLMRSLTLTLVWPRLRDSVVQLEQLTDSSPAQAGGKAA
jgi:MATE family multidrug resistance protein